MLDYRLCPRAENENRLAAHTQRILNSMERKRKRERDNNNNGSRVVWPAASVERRVPRGLKIDLATTITQGFRQINCLTIIYNKS